LKKTGLALQIVDATESVGDSRRGASLILFHSPKVQRLTCGELAVDLERYVGAFSLLLWLKTEVIRLAQTCDGAFEAASERGVLPVNRRRYTKSWKQPVPNLIGTMLFLASVSSTITSRRRSRY